METRVDRFVGRVDETARAVAALDRALAGEGALLVFRGEAGIGKTRLAERTATLARERGARVAWGRAWEEGGAPPYWPWILAFRELGVPDLFAAATERFELFDRVVTQLRDATKETPLVIVLDDLHCADVPTLLLLQFVVRSLRGLRLLIVVTHREAEARASVDVADVLAKVAREGNAIALRRLSEAEVATWVRGEVAGATDETVRRVYGVTEGNPLFVEEVLRLGADVGSDVPEDVRAIVRQHLARLSTGTRELLSCAAVLGREWSATDLAAVIERDRAAIEVAVAEALTAGVLVRSGARVAFAHGLLREALVLGLSPLERSAIHWSLGEMQASDPAKLSVAAHHLLAGALVGDTDLAIEVALRAASHAMEIAAFEDAAQLMEQAIELHGAGDDARLGELLVAHGEACIASGAIERGRRDCVRAAAIAKKLGARALVVRAALAYAPELDYDGNVDPVMVDLLRDALANIADDAPGDRARIKARLAAALLPPEKDSIAEVRTLAREAIDEARSLGNADTLIFVLSFAALAVGAVLGTDRGAVLDELLLLTSKRGRKFMELKVTPWRILDLDQAGECARARVAIEEYARLVDEVGLPHYQWRVPLMRSVECVLAGRFEEAEALGRDAVRIGEEAESRAAAREVAFLRLTIAMASERMEVLVEHQAELLATFDAIPFGAALVAYILAANHRPEEARARLRVGIDRFGDIGLALVCAAETAILLRDVDYAQEIYARIAERKDLLGFIWGPMGEDVVGPTERVLGDLAGFLGRRDEALAHYERARDVCRRIGADAFLALIEKRAKAIGGGPSKKTSAPSGALALVPEGDGWKLTTRSGATFHLKAQKGAAYLAYLLERPRQAVHVMELLTIDAGTELEAGDAGAILDPKAKASYAARVADLRAEIDEAVRFSDQARADRARAELDAIAEQLAQATGLGGRDRKAASQVERARINVQRCLKDTLKKIAVQDPALGRQLEASLKTGTYCSFDPI